MKGIFYTILIGIILSCNNSKSNSKNLTELNCANERELLSNSKSNWKIPLDSVSTINDYILTSKNQLKSPKAWKGIEKTKYGMSMYSNIYPYVDVNGINIGLMPLVRSTGHGYISYAGDSFRIEVNKEQEINIQIKQKVFEYYRDFKPNTKFDSSISMRLEYPRIDLTFIGNSFYKIDDALNNISLGYLKATELKSEEIFSKKICELNSIELNKLKSDFKLNIRIFKMGGTE